MRMSLHLFSVQSLFCVNLNAELKMYIVLIAINYSKQKSCSI